ncbi:MAG: acetyltransferase [Nitrospirota bacterium]
MKEALVLIGGGGHCRACIDVIEAAGNFSIAGIVDVNEKKGSNVLGYPLFAGDDELPSLMSAYRYFLITIGQVKSPDKRRQLFAMLKGLGAELPSITSPSARVSDHAAIGEGAIIMHGAIVGPGSRIGRNCIINTGAVIEHDCVIEDHCHISTGAVVNGECRIGGGTLVGSGSVLNNGLTISGNTIVGAGAVVTRSIDESGTYVGVPARKIVLPGRAV